MNYPKKERKRLGKVFEMGEAAVPAFFVFVRNGYVHYSGVDGMESTPSSITRMGYRRVNRKKLWCSCMGACLLAERGWIFVYRFTADEISIVDKQLE